MVADGSSGKIAIRSTAKLAMLSAVAYVLAWIVALSSGAPSLGLRADAQSVLASFSRNRAPLLVQFVFAEGVAAVALAISASAVHRIGKVAGVSSAARYFRASAYSAAALSWVMCALGLWLIFAIAPADDGALAQKVHGLINRIDGPKMWLLAVLGIAAVPFARRGLVPRWVTITGLLMTLALLVSGAAYLLLEDAWAMRAYVSGVLLLLFVGAFGISLYRRSRPIGIAMTVRTTEP